MKKDVFIFTVLLLAVGSSCCYAQQFKLGIQGGYATELEKAVVGVDSEVLFIDRIGISPSFNYYLPPDKKEYGPVTDRHNTKVNYYEVNIDFHGYVVQKKMLGVYGILGLNYITQIVVEDGDKEKDKESGSNIGLGLISGDGFIEAKYESVGTGQFVFLIGFRSRIEKKKK